MSVTACAAMVERSDPDRFAATMAAPPAARGRLWPLYALNLELARAAWVSPEPLVCQMRLQWWIDALGRMEAGVVPAHEVAGPLAAVVAAARLPVTLLQDMAEARIHDTTGEGFADNPALWRYLDQTAGHLMWGAALALGAGPEAEGPVRDFAAAAGLANWFCAVAELTARNREPLPDASAAGILALSREGLRRLSAARRSGALVPRPVAPALFPGWQAEGLLRQAAREPDRVTSGRLGLSDFARRGGLAWRAFSGRW